MATRTEVVYQKGTLKYTAAGLAVLFFYLLWGDFCMQMMEAVVPTILPLQLKELGASNSIMAFLVTTLPSMMNFAVNPIVSFRSDGFRSQWGRRIPFLFVATPFVTGSLIVMAFSPEIGAALAQARVISTVGISQSAVIIGTMAVCLIFFQFFNWCLTPVYYYLFVDVVPEAVIGRFMSFFRIVATFSSYLYNMYVFQHAITHTREIYIGAALLYLLGFGLMCFKVREGEYPPPAHPPTLGFWLSIRTYCRECYSHPHYLLFNARNAMFSIAGVTAIYGVFIIRDDIGIPLSVIGQVIGWSSLATALLLVPLGFLVDRSKPVFIILIASGIITIVPVLKYFFLHSFSAWIMFGFLTVPVMALFAAAELPFHVSVLPKDRYGQFGSANQIVCSIATIAGSLAAGQFMDLATQGGAKVSGYRLLFVWDCFFQILAFLFMFLFYLSWRKHGGPLHYVPPETSRH